jgi:low temperature requirement protein LtrA
MPTADKKVSWLELFFDLAFAGAVAEIGATLAHDSSLEGLLRFAFLFSLIGSAWVGATLFVSRFGSEDAVQRLLTLGQMFAVATMAVNAEGPLGGRDSAGFAAAYAGMRLLLAVQYWRTRRHPDMRRLVTAHATGIGAVALLWLASALAPAPLRFALWGVALALDIAIPMRLSRSGGRFPPHPEHLPERFGLFTIILLGESVIAVMAGMKEQEHWTAPAALSAAAGLGVAFAVWWCYFDTLKAAAPRHVRTWREARLLSRWGLAHYPLCLGIALSAVGVEHVIIHDGIAPLSGLQGWILGGGMALVLASLGMIRSTTHRHIAFPD